MSESNASNESTESLLDGVRIIDLTQWESGPSATQMLAWLGADVIKIEPPSGDPGRSLAGANSDRESIFFHLLNRNKSSLVLDLKQEADRDILFEMLAQADVLSENFAPGTLARLGLDVDELRARFPHLVIATVRGYAPGGPWEDFKSFDFVGQAVSGAISVTGEANRPPVRIGASVVDSGTGLHLAIGILAALLKKERTGKGSRIELSLQDSMVNMMRNAMIPMYVTGKPTPRVGDAYTDAAPSGLHPCAPGGPNDYVYILLGSKNHWNSLLTAIGREDLIGDERYHRQSERNKKPEEAREIVHEWTRNHGKLDAMEHLSRHGVPCGATLDTCELLVNEHLTKTGMITEQELRGWGPIRLPGCPIRVDGLRMASSPAPELGEGGDALLSKLREPSKRNPDNASDR